MLGVIQSGSPLGEGPSRGFSPAEIYGWLHGEDCLAEFGKVPGEWPRIFLSLFLPKYRSRWTGPATELAEERFSRSKPDYPEFGQARSYLWPGFLISKPVAVVPLK